MSHILRGVTMAVALLGSVGSALAAGDQAPGPSRSTQMHSENGGSSRPFKVGNRRDARELSLISSEKQMIAQGLAAKRAAPGGSFQAAPGAKVPGSIALKPVPMSLSVDIPSVRRYSCAKLHVLVDPKDRTVAAVIEAQASTTGSGAAPSGDRSGPMRK